MGLHLLPSFGPGDAVTIDGPSTSVWDLLEEPIAIDRLAAALAERHGADPQVVEDDVSRLLRDLCRRGLVREAP